MPEPQDKITMPSEPLEATMNKRLIAAAAATALGASAASAEPPTIPPEFGENGVHRNRTPTTQIKVGTRSPARPETASTSKF